MISMLNIQGNFFNNIEKAFTLAMAPLPFLSDVFCYNRCLSNDITILK